MSSVKFVVGDCFKDFISSVEALSWSDFCNLDEADINKGKDVYCLGQGISVSDVNKVEHDRPGLFSHIVNPHVVNKSLQISHKRKIENCHITYPLKKSANEYVIDVMFDQNCSDLSDHLTGKHISGMALIEAARQAMLAVTECYYTKNENFYFVLSDMSCSFKQFVYPLPIKIQYFVECFNRYNRNGRDQLDFKVICSFLQLSVMESCIVQAGFSLYDKTLMQVVEENQAIELIEDAVHSVDFK